MFALYLFDAGMEITGAQAVFGGNVFKRKFGKEADFGAFFV